MLRFRGPAIMIVWATVAASTALGVEGNPMRGAQVARACMACHSFTPGRHMTGPSLANAWGRKAGSAAGFGRYSDALKQSGLVWDPQHLDAWIKNPAALMPDNDMCFPGIDDARARADLIAYLEAVSRGRVRVPDNGLPNLKEADAASQVIAIRYCGDASRLTTADRKAHTFWEFNLRFKIDGSANGPPAGKPVIVAAACGATAHRWSSHARRRFRA